MLTQFSSDFPIVFLCLVFAYYFYNNRLRIPKGFRLPPGPPGKFLVGNLYDLPPGDKPEYIKYAELAKYGDLVYLNVLGKSMLLVNSPEMTHELFVKRGAIYSDRETTQMLHELTCFGNNSVIAMPYGNKWTEHRALIHDLLSPKELLGYRNLWEKSARTFLCDLKSHPDNIRAQIRHSLGAFIMELLYGIKILPQGDPYIDLAERTLKAMTKCLLPGAYRVDVFPMLKYLPSWFPGLEFPKVAKELDQTYLSMMELPFGVVERSLKSGNATPSFVANHLENIMDEPSMDKKDFVKQVAAALYVGGIDTTDCALQIFFLAMALHPEVQKKAQEELDRVVGKDALPSFSDQENLPYINAICKEVQRWHPVGPVSLPHRLIQDDVIGEYFIPKGTMVMGNTRYLLRSPAKYGPDAHKFNPDRFLDGKLGFPDIAFGYGRRVCPGKAVAEATAFITIASVLHVFNISPYDEREIREIFEKDLFDLGVLSRPSTSFRCRIETRPGLEKTLQQIMVE